MVFQVFVLGDALCSGGAILMVVAILDLGLFKLGEFTKLLIPNSLRRVFAGV